MAALLLVPAGAAPPDPEIARMISEISAERIQRSIFVLSSFKTRHTLSDPLPSGDGVGGAGAWIRAEFERVSAGAGGRLRVETDEFRQAPLAPRVPRPVMISNVVATLPGSRPESAPRVYVLCAHYDSMPRSVMDSESAAPGANDDASGVAVVLESARVLSHYEFPATLVFIAFSGEEQALLGSAHWAAQARAQGRNIAGVLSNDIVGNTHSPNGAVDRDTVRVFAQGVPPPAALDEDWIQRIRAGGENDSPARELARFIKDCAAAYVPSMAVRVIYRNDRYMRGGDHLSFLDQGFPAVRFTEPAEDFRHEHENVRTEGGVAYGDLPDFIDFVYVGSVARVNAAALATLARAPAPPRRVEIEAVRLENDTTLRWLPNAEPDLAGYRVVWRETTSPFWEHSRDFPKDATRVTLPGLSKDNTVFGVEAFDTAGRASPAVFPATRRTL